MKALKKVKKVLCVKGPDAQSFLHGLLTIHVKRLLNVKAEVKGSQAFLLNHRGQIDFDFTLIHSHDSFYLAVEAPHFEALKNRLEHFLISEDLEILDLSESFSDFWWLLDPVEIAEENILRSSSKFSEDKIFIGREHEWGFDLSFLHFGVPLRELWIKNGQIPNLSFQNMSSDEFLNWRCERGLPLRDEDYNSSQFLSDLPYLSSVAFDKGCYLGQEVVAKAKNLGRAPRVFLVFKSETPWIRFSKIQNSKGEDVGEIRSSSGNFALGFLRTHVFESGENIFSEGKAVFYLKNSSDKNL
jgi:folate-binding protein YgfZ